VRESLEKKLPDVIKDMSLLTFLIALIDACEKHGIHHGDKTRLRDAWLGKGMAKPGKDVSLTTKILIGSFWAANRPLLDRLFQVKSGIKKGQKKTPKALTDKEGNPLYKSPEDFYNVLYGHIRAVSGHYKATRRLIARKMKMKVDALDDLLHKTLRDKRSWEEIVRDAKKTNGK
jgi:hypothetical protein